jgi:hypothetical protein
MQAEGFFPDFDVDRLALLSCKDLGDLLHFGLDSF